MYCLSVKIVINVHEIYEIFSIGAWRSLVAHLLWEQGVGGSNPLAPTSFLNSSRL